MSWKKLFYCLIETTVLSAIIFIFFFLNNPLREKFLDLNIHPLLLVSLIMGMRYGNYIGIIAATLCTATYMSAYIMLGKDLYLFAVDFDLYKFVLMFYLSAAIFGKFKDDYDNKIASLKQEIEIVTLDYEKVRGNYEKLKIVNDELKNQIIGTEDSILSLYSIANSLESVEPEEIYTEIMGVLISFLKAKTVSVYTLNANKDFLRLKVRFGENPKLPNSVDIKKYPDLVKPMTDRASNQNKNESMPILHAPIFYENKIIGLINIEEISFDMVNEYTYNLFKIIVEWTSKSLARAVKYDKLVNTSDRYIENTSLMKYDEFQKRLKEEDRRQEKYNMEYTLFAYHQGDHTLEELDEKVGRVTREVDVASYDVDGRKLYVLFPATPSSFSPKIEERISEKFEGRLEKA